MVDGDRRNTTVHPSTEVIHVNKRQTLTGPTLAINSLHLYQGTQRFLLVSEPDEPIPTTHVCPRVAHDPRTLATKEGLDHSDRFIL